MMANNDKKRFPANQPIVQLTITGPELPIVMFVTNCCRRSYLCIGNRLPMDISYCYTLLSKPSAISVDICICIELC